MHSKTLTKVSYIYKYVVLQALTRCRLTWSTQYIEDKAGQHERQHRPVVTEVSISELLGSLSDGGHFYQTQRNFL